MKLKNIAVGLTAVAALAAPLTLATPAEAKPDTVSCVRIAAPGSHAVEVGHPVTLNIRTSKALQERPGSHRRPRALRRVPGRDLRIKSAYYYSGGRIMKIRVKAKGHQAVTRTLTCRVEK